MGRSAIGCASYWILATGYMSYVCAFACWLLAMATVHVVEIQDMGFGGRSLPNTIKAMRPSKNMNQARIVLPSTNFEQGISIVLDKFGTRRERDQFSEPGWLESAWLVRAGRGALAFLVEPQSLVEP